MKKYKEAVAYLDTFLNYEKKGFKGGEKFSLVRVRAALKKLGHPDHAYVSAHIAGTKGKGSVATFASSTMCAAGMRTGLYTSPHLSSPRERIKFNGKMISKKEFSDGVFYLKKTLGSEISAKLTYFEIFTLLAMWHFKKRKVDVAVFETGMGGRFDATSIVVPAVSCITPISYDHTAILGTSLKKIAGEKSAIIKKGSVCVSACQKRSALNVIKKRCDDVGAKLILAGREIKTRITGLGPKGTVFDIETPLRRYKGCRTAMIGEFQPENAALSVAICEEMWRSLRPGEISGEAVKRGIKKAFIEGRMEVLSERPLVVIDGAQNASSCEKLVRSVGKIFDYEKLTVIVAFCVDKDIKGACAELSGIADTVIVTRARTGRAAENEKIARYFLDKKVIMTSSAKEAITSALVISGERDLVLAAGSFYLVGEIREIVKGKASK